MQQRTYDYELERYLVATCDHDWEIVFGKYDSFLLSVAVQEDIRYFRWIVSANFPMCVIDIICEALDVVSLTLKST